MRFVIACLLTFQVTAHAEERVLSWKPTANPVAMTSAGGIMTPAGVALLVGGASLIMRNLFACGWDGRCDAATQATIDRDSHLGAGLMAGGFATLAVGIPLLAVGANRLEQRKRFHPLPYLAPQPGGGVTGFSVRF